MDPDTLRVFVAVATTGNMTRAATSLRISQPAVSKRLLDLEEELGSPLFDRLPRGVRLTAAGSLLLPHAERILALSDIAKRELQELSGLSRGSLSVGASTTIGSYLVPQLFGLFHREHAGVALDLQIANTTQIQAAVLDDRVDMGLTEGFISSDALEVEAVAHDEMVLIVAPGHPLLSEKALDADALSDVPLLMREPGSGSRDIVEAALRRKGLTVAPVMSLGSTEALKNAVAARLGVAMVSRLAVSLELQMGRLYELPIADFTVRRALHLVRLRGKQPSTACRAFIELLREHADQATRSPTAAYAI